MNNKDFAELVSDEHQRSLDLFSLKLNEYSGEEDRNENFKQAAAVLGTNPAHALMGMMIKHVISLCRMCKDPAAYSEERWNEKIRDTRNYTYLLPSVLIDMGVFKKDDKKGE